MEALLGIAILVIMAWIGPMSRFSTNKNEKSFPILTY